MRKLSWIICAAALLAVVPRAAVAQQPQDFSKVEVKATQVSGNVYMLQGGAETRLHPLEQNQILRRGSRLPCWSKPPCPAQD